MRIGQIIRLRNDTNFSEILCTFWMLNFLKTPSSLAKWVECSLMVWENGVQSLIESYQRLKKWYLICPCLTLSIIRYVSRVKWSNTRKGVVPFPTPRCRSYWKGSLWLPSTMVANFTFLHIYIDIYVESLIDQTLNSNSNAWYFVHFIPSNFFRQRPFSEFFYLKVNEENDKMVGK